MNRFFNIAGPYFPQEHYTMPPLERLPGLLPLIYQRQYFVIHAARQTGKTTTQRHPDKSLNRRANPLLRVKLIEARSRKKQPAQIPLTPQNHNTLTPQNHNTATPQNLNTTIPQHRNAIIPYTPNGYLYHKKPDESLPAVLAGEQRDLERKNANIRPACPQL